MKNFFVKLMGLGSKEKSNWTKATEQAGLSESERRELMAKAKEELGQDWKKKNGTARRVRGASRERKESSITRFKHPQAGQCDAGAEF